MLLAESEEGVYRHDDVLTRFVIVDEILCITEMDLDQTRKEDEYFEVFKRQQAEYFIRRAHGFILVYSITSRDSFESLEKKRRNVERVKDSDGIPMVLVGSMKGIQCPIFSNGIFSNFSSLDFCNRASARAVSTEEGADLARIWGIPFYEVNSETR
jgi:GTPase KRas protein